MSSSTASAAFATDTTADHCRHHLLCPTNVSENVSENENEMK